MSKNISVSSKQPTLGELEKYLSSLPEDFRAALQEIRETVLAMAPDVTEAFVYGVPGFKFLGKSLVCYAGFKNHCGFYPMNPELIKTFAKDLKNFKLSKGTIRFTPEQPLPRDMVEKIIKARITEIESEQQ